MKQGLKGILIRLHIIRGGSNDQVTVVPDVPGAPPSASCSGR